MEENARAERGTASRSSSQWAPPRSQRSRAGTLGRSVQSPCGGTVPAAVDGLPDLIPSQRDCENPAGNHVVISYQNVELMLAHLHDGSVAVPILFDHDLPTRNTILAWDSGYGWPGGVAGAPSFSALLAAGCGLLDSAQ